MNEAAEEDLLEELRGRKIISAQRGDGGLHIDLDGDKTLVILGIVAVVNRSATPLQ